MWCRWSNSGRPVTRSRSSYVKTSLTTALDRNANRERIVPEDVVREKHTIVETSFQILSGYADAVTTIINDPLLEG